MRQEGLAWITAHPSGLTRDIVVAFVEVDCLRGRTREVLGDLSRHGHVVSIEQAARGRDLQLTVMTPDLASLTEFVLDELLEMPGVQRQRTTLATAIHRQASDWRLDALNRQQRSAFESARQAARVPRGGGLPRDSWPLIEALARDGRASAADLARSLGMHPATVRRQLARVLASEAVAFRCEVAQVPSLWPLDVGWLVRVPEAERERTVAAVATLPELRLCVSTTGEANMMVKVWIRSQADLPHLEHLVAERLPWLTVVETVVTLRTTKRMGWIISPSGRATGEVVTPSALRPPS